MGRETLRRWLRWLLRIESPSLGRVPGRAADQLAPRALRGLGSGLRWLGTILEQESWRVGRWVVFTWGRGWAFRVARMTSETFPTAQLGPVLVIFQSYVPEEDT